MSNLIDKIRNWFGTFVLRNSKPESEQPDQTPDRTDDNRSCCSSSCSQINQQENVQTTSVSVSSSEPVSRLDNKAWVKLLESVVKLQEEMERKMKKVPEDAQDILDYFISRIDDLLELNRLERIDGETKFDRIRHKSVGKTIVENGQPIISTIAPGWSVEDRVFKRAKVQVQVLSEEKSQNGEESHE